MRIKIEVLTQRSLRRPPPLHYAPSVVLVDTCGPLELLLKLLEILIWVHSERDAQHRLAILAE